MDETFSTAADANITPVVTTVSSEAWRTARAGLTSALQVELADSALDGLPVPGAKTVFGGVISTIRQI